MMYSFLPLLLDRQKETGCFFISSFPQWQLMWWMKEHISAAIELSVLPLMSALLVFTFFFNVKAF